MFTDKFITAYIKQHAIESADSDHSQIHRDKDDYLAGCLNIYEKYCKGTPLKEQISTWLELLDITGNPEYLGYKTAFVARSPKFLNDALFQSVSIAHATQVCRAAGDHCANYRIALLALAGGMVDRIPLLLPEEVGMSKNGHIVATSITNLIMALWYKRADFIEESRKMAMRALGNKQPAIYYAQIRYLLALLDGDVVEAGIQLDLFCRGVPKVQEFGVSKLKKMFWPPAHGLYNLAFAVLGKKMALEIPMPAPDCFCCDLAKWQIEHDFRPGNLFFDYPKPIDLVNNILRCTPPAIVLFQPYLNTEERYRHEWFVNGDYFKEQLVASILDIIL